MVALLSCTMFAAADDYSCRVYGADNVASLIRTSATAYLTGIGPEIKIYVALTKPADEDTTIVVKVSDGSSIIGTAHVFIKKGEKTPMDTMDHSMQYQTDNMEVGKTYKLTIARASCQ